VPTAALPTDSPFLSYAYDVAHDVVNPFINRISPIQYTLAVYNLGGDRLVNFCPDQAGQTYFEGLRSPPPAGFGLFNFVPGVVQSAADVSTSDGLLVPEFMKGLTLQNLALLKTPWGRQYLAIAQDTGTIWGLTG
jgi:hypothetical protein